jgi:hypothetical protein
LLVNEAAKRIALYCYLLLLLLFAYYEQLLLLLLLLLLHDCVNDTAACSAYRCCAPAYDTLHTVKS